MLDKLIKEVAQTLVTTAIPNVDRFKLSVELDRNLDNVDNYIVKNGASELNHLTNVMHGAIAMDLLRKRSTNKLIPAYAYILYTEGLDSNCVGGVDAQNEAWLKKAYILINTKWATVRAIIMLGSMGTELIHRFGIEDLLNILILGNLLNIRGNFLQSQDLRLYESLTNMRSQYHQYSDAQIKEIRHQIDANILASKDWMLK